MNSLQQHQLWIGLSFAIFLVIFLIAAFFKAKEMTNDQRTILKFLTALCAAFSGALITGDALFKMEGTMENGMKFAITGAAGFALFFTVWFFYPKVIRLPEAFNFSVPSGWTFQQTVDALAKTDNSVVEYEGFTQEELDAPLKAWEVHGKNTGGAISAIRSITNNPNAVRKYDVKRTEYSYHLRINT